jgi:hypothetical protein
VTRQDLAGWSFTSGVSNYTLAGPPGAWMGPSMPAMLTVALIAGWVSTKADGLPTPHPDWYSEVGKLVRRLLDDTI